MIFYFFIKFSLFLGALFILYLYKTIFRFRDSRKKIWRPALKNHERCSSISKLLTNDRNNIKKTSLNFPIKRDERLDSLPGITQFGCVTRGRIPLVPVNLAIISCFAKSPLPKYRNDTVNLVLPVITTTMAWQVQIFKNDVTHYWNSYLY